MTDEDGVTTAVSGTLTGTAATTCTWALSAGDSGTAGTFTVLFQAIVTGVTTYTLEATLEVIANPAVTGTQNDPLVSISAADAAWVTLAATAVPDGADVVDANDLGTAAAANVGDFDAAGAAAAAQAAAIAASVSKAGDTMAGLLQFSGTGHAGIKLNALTAAQRDAIAAGAGMVIFNSDAGQPCYYDGTVWRRFSDDAIALPYEIDFASLDDGYLPAPFVGSTWAIVGGVAVNTPTLGSELLTDPGLEGTYTSGKANALTKTGSPTLTESADAHGGVKAQQFVGVAIANAVYWAAAAATAGNWYQFSIYGKRTAGTQGNVGMGIYLNAAQPFDSPFRAITSATYTQHKMAIIATSTDLAFRYAARQLGANASDTVIVDDGAYKVITRSTVYTLAEMEAADTTVKIQPSAIVDGTLFGMVLRASATTDPDNCIYVMLRLNEVIGTIMYISVVKKIGSTYTRVLNETTQTIVSDGWLEARMSGSTVQIFYNDVQKGSDLTIADAELLDNTIHGMFSTGDNTIEKFYCGDPVEMSQDFAGTSFTNAIAGYRPIATAWQKANYPRYDFTFTNYALDGHNSWSNLVRLTTGADLFVIDHANDGVTAWERASLEAIIRRLWTANADTRIIIINSPTWFTQDTSNNAVVNTPTNQTIIEEIETLAAHYGIPIVDYWGWCQTNVPSPYNLNQITTDTVHPSTAVGYPAMAALLEVYLPTGGASKPATLPARLYDNGDYENTPTRTLGNANAGTTGTWSTTGTRIESSTAGSTVTFAATCQSFGIYRSDGGSNANLEYSVNGGSTWSNMVLYQNGTVITGGRAAYSIIIRVKTGGSARIEEFWAV
ncbi:MAG: hypothetical protein IPH82_21760 [Chloroflexi bacterium]|nr:hypothetical protein [Chloroflexota bacterium]